MSEMRATCVCGFLDHWPDDLDEEETTRRREEHLRSDIHRNGLELRNHLRAALYRPDDA